MTPIVPTPAVPPTDPTPDAPTRANNGPSPVGGPPARTAVPFRGERPWTDAPWPVAAWVPPDDVPDLEHALGRAAVVIPCDSLDALTRAVRDGAHAAIIGADCVAKPDVTGLLVLTMQSPSTVFLGLTDTPASSSGAAARAAWLTASRRLERAGVPAVGGLDAEGRHLLNRSIASACLADPVQRACVALLLRDVWGAYRTHRGGPVELELLRFFAAAFAPEVESVEEVAARLGLDATALRAQFVRRGLPSADRYVAAARLVRAAWVSGPIAASASPASHVPVVATVAPAAIAAAVATAAGPVHPEAPAPIRRAVRRLRRVATRAVGVPRGPGAGILVLDSYRVALVLPFLRTFRTFNPAGGLTVEESF